MSKKRIFSQEIQEGSSRSAIPLEKTVPELVNGIPISAEDYLLTVRQEAEKCAKVVVAPPPKEIKKTSLPFHFQFLSQKSNEEDQVNSLWSQGFSLSFQSYQKFMQANKTKKNGTTIKTIEQGKQLVLKSTDYADLASSLSQHSILALLKYHVTWLDINEFEKQCLCLFSLLVYLDRVLTSNNISILRDVSRKCIEMRHNVTNKAPLNIIVTIISEIFGQGDLK